VRRNDFLAMGKKYLEKGIIATALNVAETR
jgi:hypothetical protein